MYCQLATQCFDIMQAQGIHAVRFSKIQYLWQYRVMISSVFYKEPRRPYRYSPRFAHFEIVDIHGDRHEIYTRDRLTVSQVLRDIRQCYSVHHVSGLMCHT